VLSGMETSLLESRLPVTGYYAPRRAT
jgi:hypothetical protein